MATIIKRKKAYSVVYNYVDENGETKQKWETVHTHKEALRRKAEVENTQNAGTFLPPNKQTVREFLHDFVATYGERKWSISMYDGQLSLISNYINPIIGDLEVRRPKESQDTRRICYELDHRENFQTSSLCL